jgi:hypothetical protein
LQNAIELTDTAVAFLQHSVQTSETVNDSSKKLPRRPAGPDLKINPEASITAAK